MKQTIQIIAIEQNEVIGRGQRQSACGSCKAKGACSSLGSWAEKPVDIRLANTLAAQIGDWVEIETSERALLRATFILYAMPVLVFISSGLLALVLKLSEAISAIIALLSVGAYVYYLWWSLQHKKQSSQLMPIKMIRLMSTASSPCDKGV
ncbi:MAG: SoxR reducing system RseC family protein [Mariprofundales bacterium]